MGKLSARTDRRFEKVSRVIYNSYSKMNAKRKKNPARPVGISWWSEICLL